MASPDRPDDAAVVVSAASRALRRRLRPLAWVTLEEVALDAVDEDGRLVARTSARQVAERLGVDPGTAAGALRALRRKGLLALEREQGSAGRFGLSVYVLGSVAGLTVLTPGAKTPHMSSPPWGNSYVDEPGVGVPLLFDAPQNGRPGMDEPQTAPTYADALRSISPCQTEAVTAEPDRPQRRAWPVPPSPHCPRQEAFDL
jgi:DNA-binding transcriptional ArsR family regulator